MIEGGMSIVSLFDRDMLNVIVDNNGDNYDRCREEMSRVDNYNWFHIKNAYYRDNYACHTDPNFYAFDSLTQISNSKLFDELKFNTNHYKVERNMKISFSELKYWKNDKNALIDVKVENLKVIHGKKVGRTLGIPTG